MASLNIVLDTRRAKSDNSFPVYLRLTHQRQSRNISTGSSIPEDQWNYKKNCVKPSYANASRLNFSHDRLKTEAQRILLDHQTEIELLSIDEVKSLILKKNSKSSRVPTFFEFGYQLVERYRKANKIGSAAAYKCCLQIVSNYVGHKEIPFTQITYQFLLDFEAHLLGTGVKVNSIGGYMRHLRAVINQAIAEGYMSQDKYPFKKFRIKKEMTAKRAISKVDILKMANCDVSDDTVLQKAQHLFTFMFHTRGMNFVDLAHLRACDITDGRLVYRRQKTGKLYNIKLTTKALDIIACYISTEFVHSTDYIFPIIPNDVLGDKEKEWQRIVESRKQFNNNLKRIAKRIGLEVNMTSYVIRHSWASIAKFSGIAPAVIGESLGHSDLKTTETYLAEFEHQVLDDANDLIVM